MTTLKELHLANPGAKFRRKEWNVPSTHWYFDGFEWLCGYPFGESRPALEEAKKNDWELYKEPRKQVFYVNVYDDWCDGFYMDRIGADVAHRNISDTRIACKRVEFVEGEFDE